jgi:osmotically-inducible protein OsmY
MKQLLLLLVILPTLLQGCAAPVLVAGAAGGAAVNSGERSADTLVEDQFIETKANDLLYADPKLAKRIHINITSYNHVVLLTGEALSRSLRDHTVNVVRNLNKVRRVHNEIRIADLTNFRSRSRDSWITSKVKTQMIAAKSFPSSRVKVITETGTVYLMGLVSRKTGKRAAEITRNIEGVKRVVKLFEYGD